MTSLKSLSSGQQIMDSYGKKCNSKFLMHYGFAIENNREEDGKCQNEMPLVFMLEVSFFFFVYSFYYICFLYMFIFYFFF